MKRVVPIISPFDGYSKKPGSAGSARAWRKLCEKESCIEYPREMGPFLPKLLGWDMAEVASRGDVDCVWEGIIALHSFQSRRSPLIMAPLPFFILMPTMIAMKICS